MREDDSYNGPVRVVKWPRVIVIVVALAAAAPAYGQESANSALAYAQFGCYCVGACPAFCFYPNASWAVTPFGQTDGLGDTAPTWSPDATHIAFMRQPDVFIMDVRGGDATTLLIPGPNWRRRGRRTERESRSSASDLVRRDSM